MAKQVKEATSKRMLDYCKEDARLTLATMRLVPIDTEGVEIEDLRANHLGWGPIEEEAVCPDEDLCTCSRTP